ncbi:MAG: response regulator transcription factor [Flavobacteriaceae bacterium]|nr:response regulator transcription factor [Flavobacteriaceae bacterium]
MKCIIIDDDKFYINFLKKYCEKLDIEVVGVYQDSVLAFQELECLSKCDVVFLDINMPDISGFDILNNNLRTQVVILSADDANAVKAFDHDVVDYLQKPFSFARFLRAINRVKEKMPKPVAEARISEHKNKTYVSSEKVIERDGDIFVNINKKLIKLDISDVVLVEAKGDYVLIKRASSSNLIVHSTLKRMKDKLPEDSFLQVHRSFIVNLKKIVDIAESTVVVGREVVPISRGNRAVLLSKLNVVN